MRICFSGLLDFLELIFLEAELRYVDEVYRVVDSSYLSEPSCDNPKGSGRVPNFIRRRVRPKLLLFYGLIVAAKRRQSRFALADRQVLLRPFARFGTAQVNRLNSVDSQIFRRAQGASEPRSSVPSMCVRVLKVNVSKETVCEV